MGCVCLPGYKQSVGIGQHVFACLTRKVFQVEDLCRNMGI